MEWQLSHRAHLPARLIADQHYSRQKPGTPQFVPPGRCVVLLTKDRDALWVTSWPFAQYVKHAWAGAWQCSMFRRLPECPSKASELNIKACAVTRHQFGDPPELGFITFVDPKKVNPIMVRGEKTWGYSYIKAGWRRLDETTKGGLLVFHLPPDLIPQPAAPGSDQYPFAFSFGASNAG